jgi:sporulation protein YlmC with PRC-barrel domain
MKCMTMKRLIWGALCVTAAVTTPRSAAAQVAGAATIGVTIEEMKVVVLGWSAKRKLLGAAVYNDRGEKIGSIDDIIVSPKRTVSHAIIGVGGFLGIGRHQVAIPMDQIKLQGNRFVLAGATKDVLRAMPEFQYGP